MFASNLKEKAKEKIWFLLLDSVFGLSPNSWIYLEANGLSDVPALSDVIDIAVWLPLLI